MKSRALAVLLLGSLALLALSPAAYGRASGRTDPVIEAAVVQAPVAGGGALEGFVQITAFDVADSGLVVVGLLRGTVTYPSGATAQLDNEPVVSPVTALAADCGLLLVTLGPTQTSLGVVDLSSATADMSVVNAPPKQICAVGKVARSGDDHAVAALLNNLL